MLAGTPFENAKVFYKLYLKSFYKSYKLAVTENPKRPGPGRIIWGLGYTLVCATRKRGP
jgi:hypothetical protein